MQDIIQLMADAPAIQNLDFLRQLIAEARMYDQMGDEQRLRMLRDTDMGTAALSMPQVDR